MLAKKQAYKWAVNFKDSQVDKLTEASRLVYLSPDAEEVLEEFDPEFANQSQLRHRRTVRQKPVEGGESEEGRRARGQDGPTASRQILPQKPQKGTEYFAV